MTSLNSALRRLIFRLRGGVPRLPPNDAFIQLAHPRDLDDPFSDPETQARVAQVIADKAAKKIADRR